VEVAFTTIAFWVAERTNGEDSQHLSLEKKKTPAPTLRIKSNEI
jgi:hypothetical protein